MSIQFYFLKSLLTVRMRLRVALWIASSERGHYLTVAGEVNWPSLRPRRSHWSLTRTLNVFHQRYLSFLISLTAQLHSHAHKAGSPHPAGDEGGRGERPLLFSMNEEDGTSQLSS